MRYEKLDPALQSALSDGKTDSGTGVFHLVFLQTDLSLDASAHSMLESLEVKPAAPASGIYTASLTREEIGRLSEQGWVRELRLSRQLRPLQPGQ